MKSSVPLDLPEFIVSKFRLFSGGLFIDLKSPTNRGFQNLSENWDELNKRNVMPMH